ncbi:hypothetical protein [Crenothrix polyspora]|uniref:Uncharacterized protein n=1 Tax=Crenothrix polyspora TaxID=360316 RepID=A0A1R4HIH8_9GAMM|nr:hypothetical protein [Crenothrix polyspora]SJM96035.1 hypothetical protein CRENPOLYSF1_830023 [Crenothrix polyspora]
MVKYSVLSPIKLIDGIAKLGDVVELTDKDAESLLVNGVIELAQPAVLKEKPADLKPAALEPPPKK